MFEERDALGVLGRRMFGVALIAFGAMQFFYGDVVVGRAPAWPSEIPGRWFAAASTGALLIAAGIAIVAGRALRAAGLGVAALIFLFAAIRNAMLLAAHPGFGIGAFFGKALALFGGSLAIPASAPDREDGLRRLGTIAGRVGLGAFMIFGGSFHFMFTNAVASLIPAWFPYPIVWTYLGGTGLILGGAGLILPPTTRDAALASGLMIGAWVVTLHLPRALSAATQAAARNEWTALFEALAFSGTALVLSAAKRTHRTRT